MSRRVNTVIILLFLLSNNSAFAQGKNVSANKYEVGAYYFPNYHKDYVNAKWHGKRWTEWELVKATKSRFKGRDQPNVPAWGYLDESAFFRISPANAERTDWAKPVIDTNRPAVVGSRRELFVDSTLIESMSGAALELQIPQIGEMSLDFREKSWETPWASGSTILKDGILYRMYYYVPMTKDRVASETHGGTAYAESTDGISWTRPNLGQVEFGMSSDNNMLLLPANARPFRLIRPFIDNRPGIPASQKYKAVTGGVHYTGIDGAKYVDGLYILVSADGIHWSKYTKDPFVPAQRFSSPDGQSNYPNPIDYDGMNTMFWSESEQLYVSLYRSWIKISPLKSPDDSYWGTGWYRWVKRTTSPDLVTWSTPVLMGTGGLLPEQWYLHSMAPYFRAPHIYIGMPSHYMPIANPEFGNAPDDGHVARCETRFVISRAGTTHFDRRFATSRFITTGLDNSNFNFTNLSNWPVFAGRMSLNVVPTGPAEISCYLEQAGRIVRYKLRTDGFVALSAPNTGTVVTKAITFTGRTLNVNYAAAPGGSLKVEIEDANGIPLTGYTLADATSLAGDHVSKNVTWGRRSSLSQLERKTIKIKFLLRNAKLYSYVFQ